MSCHLNITLILNGLSLGSNHIQTLLGCMLLYTLEMYSQDTTESKSSYKTATEAQKEEASGILFCLVWLAYKFICDLLSIYVCFPIIKIRMVIRNDPWHTAVIFIFFKLHLGDHFWKTDNQFWWTSFFCPYRMQDPEKIFPNIYFNQTVTSHFSIFQECCRSEKFQTQG